MPSWGWLVLGAIILISELIVSTDFYLIFFAAAAVIVGLLGLSGVSIPVSAQWLLFASLSIGTLVLFRARLRRMIKTREHEVDKLEEEIAVAMRAVITAHHICIEGAAGVAVAGFLQDTERYADKDVAIVLCGANASMEVLRRVLT